MAQHGGAYRAQARVATQHVQDRLEGTVSLYAGSEARRTERLFTHVYKEKEEFCFICEIKMSNDG